MTAWTRNVRWIVNSDESMHGTSVVHVCIYWHTHTPFEYLLSLPLQVCLLLSALFHSFLLHSFCPSEFFSFSRSPLVLSHLLPPPEWVLQQNGIVHWRRGVGGRQEFWGGDVIYIYRNKCVPPQAPVMSRVVRGGSRDDFRTPSTWSSYITGEFIRCKEEFFLFCFFWGSLRHTRTGLPSLLHV